MNDMIYKHLFGPVPSRRLGMSLGVDLVPHKTCSLNCIYCECGKTTNLTVERKEYVPTEEIINELSEFLKELPTLDYITFSGAGEPTLHSGIGKIVNFIKDNYPRYKIALLTNGTLFYQPGLIDDVKKIDLIIPSLDVASEQRFITINRPHSDLSLEKIIKHLCFLRKEFTGQLWLEIFIVPGINDSDDEIETLKTIIDRIKPDRIQLNSLDRPGTVQGLHSASVDSLQNIAGKLGPGTEIITKFQYKKKYDSEKSNTENSIVQLIKRRPCTVDDLISALGIRRLEVLKYLSSLVNQKRIELDVMERGTFYRVIDS